MEENVIFFEGVKRQGLIDVARSAETMQAPDPVSGKHWKTKEPDGCVK